MRRACRGRWATATASADGEIKLIDFAFQLSFCLESCTASPQTHLGPASRRRLRAALPSHLTAQQGNICPTWLHCFEVGGLHFLTSLAFCLALCEPPTAPWAATGARRPAAAGRWRRSCRRCAPSVLPAVPGPLRAAPAASAARSPPPPSRCNLRTGLRGESVLSQMRIWPDPNCDASCRCSLRSAKAKYILSSGVLVSSAEERVSAAFTSHVWQLAKPQACELGFAYWHC